MLDNKHVFIVNVLLIALIVVELLFGIYLIFQGKTQNTPSLDSAGVKKDNSIKIFYEKIPGSKFHGPDATWWGYNQNKIVRFKNLVFMYVIENLDDSNKTSSNFVVYKKDGNLVWEKGASLPTSRPGNILIDSKGVLHAFVFEPLDVVKNDSWGRLKHYWFPDSAKGDIASYNQETVIDNNGTNETVNIRIGAAIGPDDTLAFAFGMGKFNNLYKDFSEHLYIKKPTDTAWTHLIAGEELGHEWYYPFVWMEKDSYHLLPVQDDYNGLGTAQIPYPNIYQKIMYMTYKNNVWRNEIIVDLSSNPLAKSRPRLLEQEELYIDQKGTAHILYKEFLDKDTQWKATHKHVIKSSTSTSEQNIKMGKEDINWIRLFEVDDNLYYLYVLYNSAYIRKEGKDELIKISIPKDAHGTYPYIATKRGGTKDSEKYIDIILLVADQYDFKEGTNVNYYIRIPKSEFEKL